MSQAAVMLYALARRESLIDRFVPILDAILGILLILSGLVLIDLKVLIVFGFIQVPTLQGFAQANQWDFLIKLVEQADWLVVVGLILVYAGLRLLKVVSLPAGTR
jgi:hypothetical protein